MATAISCAPRSVVKIVRLEGLNNNLNGHTRSQKGRGIKKEDTGDWELNTLERMLRRFGLPFVLILFPFLNGNADSNFFLIYYRDDIAVCSPLSFAI